MPGIDASLVRAGITGAVLTAPIGTTPPADTGSSWPDGWIDLGFTTDDGISEEPTITSSDIPGWQTLYPVRTLITGRVMKWSYTLLQTTGTIEKLAAGGGTITDLGGGDFKLTPPADFFVDERAFGIEVLDGDIIKRKFIDRGLVTACAPILYKKNDATKFGLTIATLAPADPSHDPWTEISNDPAMAS